MDFDPHTVTWIVESTSALVGGVLGATGALRGIKAIVASLVERVTALENMVDAIHSRLDEWGAPQHVAKTQHHPPHDGEKRPRK